MLEPPSKVKMEAEIGCMVTEGMKKLTKAVEKLYFTLILGQVKHTINTASIALMASIVAFVAFAVKQKEGSRDWTPRERSSYGKNTATPFRE